MASPLSVLAGGHYEIGDMRTPIAMVLTAGAAVNGEVRIEARISGVGVHRIELRAFNGTADAALSTVTLTPGREQTVTWKLTVTVADMPWAVATIPDSNMSARQELFGTLHELTTIG